MQPISTTTSSDPTAVTGRRMLAWLIDAGLGALWIGLFIGATFTSTTFANDFDAERACLRINELSDDACIQLGNEALVGTASDTLGALGIWFAWALLTTMLIPGITSWSPGKLLTGLRVVNRDTFEPAGMGANIGRGLMWCFDAFPFLAPVFGLLLVSGTKGHRRLGDRVAGTIVIRADEVGRPVSLSGVNNVAPPPPLFGRADPPPPTGPRFDLDLRDDTFAAAPAPPPFAAAHAPEPVVEAAPEPVSSPAGVEAAPEPEPVVEAAPEPVSSPAGVDAPVWDEARDTYIQWDPELNTWMQWAESEGRWIRISQ